MPTVHRSVFADGRLSKIVKATATQAPMLPLAPSLQASFSTIFNLSMVLLPIMMEKYCYFQYKVPFTALMQ